MANNSKKYISLSKLSTFLNNLKTTFSQIGHNHTVSDLTDYQVDSELSSTSTNPVQNKVIDAEFEEVGRALGALDLALDGKADTSHTHAISDVTNLQNTLDGKVPNTRTVNGKALSANVTLSASDVGAAASSHTHDDRYYTEAEMDELLEGKSDTGHKHTVANITDLTATATELNYMDGVTSNVQEQLDGKAASGHTHAKLTFTGAVTGSYNGSSAKTVNIPTVPTALPNPNAITFTGAVTGTYDGNFTKTVNIVGRAGSGQNAERFNESNTASGDYSHAEGLETTASGHRSHAEGMMTTAYGENSHAEGESTIANGYNSHAEGLFTVAKGQNQHVQGKYNIEDNSNDYAHIVGNGTAYTPSNAHTLDWDGNAWYKGNVYVGGDGQASGSKLLTEVEVDSKLSGKANATHSHDDLYYTEEEIDTKLSGKANTSHNHSASDITSGTLSSDRLPTIPVAKGGTGATTAPEALANLGLTATAAELNIMDGVTATTAEINKLDGLTATTTELNYVDGVTSGIQAQLDAKQAKITGGATTIASSNLTASRALVSDASGKVAVSAVTSTELGYLDGVTSGIQSQLDGKQATITGGASTIASSNLAVNRALISNGSGKVAVSTVTSTELGYLDGVTSAIQTQLDGKASSTHTHTKADVGLGNVENKSSATIRGELTKENVVAALGYTPPTTNTTYTAITNDEIDEICGVS